MQAPYIVSYKNGNVIDIIESDKINMRKLELLALNTFWKDVIKISGTHVQFIYTLAIPSVIFMRDLNNQQEEQHELTFINAATQIKHSMDKVFFFVADINDPKMKLIVKNLKTTSTISPQIGFVIPIENKGD